MYVNNQKTCLANSMPTYRAGMCDYEVKWFYGDFRLFSIFYGIFFRSATLPFSHKFEQCMHKGDKLFVR